MSHHHWHGGAIAFVGGFGDSTLQSLFRSGLMASAAAAYADQFGGNVGYFTYDQADDLKAWVQQNGGHVTVIGQSFGAETAAQLAASGVHIDTLVTLDPVGSVANLSQVSANSGQWLNFVAAGGGLTLPNAIAAIGGAWGNITQGYATRTIDVNVDHAGIAGSDMMKSLLGIVY